MMSDWLKDFARSIHWGVPERESDWERYTETVDRMTAVEENAEALRAVVEAASAIKWGRRKDDYPADRY